jgi:two-component system cell cycle response regulator DivK
MADVLVIEDNEQNMYLCTYILESRGHRVIQAGTGSDGLTAARREMPDLIILDIQLPGMDGYAVARALKKDPATRLIPVVAVTSYAMAGDRERVLEAGCEGYIEKPIDPETFLAEIERHLRTPGKEGGA